MIIVPESGALYVCGGGGISGHRGRSKYLFDGIDIGGEQGVWDVYKLGPLASKGWLTCPPPPCLVF